MLSSGFDWECNLLLLIHTDSSQHIITIVTASDFVL